MAEQTKRTRSPNFPYSTLRDCVNYLRTLHGRVQTTQIPVDLAYKRMDMNPTSSVSFRILGAMIGYGLLDDEGTGKDKRINVSELGRRIAIDTRPDSIARLRLYREAIFNEPMMQKVWNEWMRTLPRDSETIETVLRLNYGFSNVRAANRFGSVIVDNYQFAQLDEYFEAADDIPSGEQDEYDEQGDHTPPPQRDQNRNSDKPPKDMPHLTQYPIPLDESRFAYIYLPSTVTEGDAEYIPDYVNLLLKKIRRISQNE